MKDHEIASIDRLALMMVRQGKEKSRALPQSAYGDPARHVKFESERSDGMDDKELNAHCQAWIEWCRTRKYFIRPGAKNILARMQPAKAGQEPNAPMSANMAFFNMAVHAMVDMKEYEHDARCFLGYYWDQERNVKSVAANLGIGRQTYYDRVNRFARKALSLSISFSNMGVELQQNAEVIID